MEITQIVWTDIAKDAFLNTTNDNFLLVEGKKWADKASAATVDLSTVDGTYVHITWTITITAFWTMKAGIARVIRFAWSLTLTHNATSLILPTAANITTAANDTMIALSEWSGNWRVLAYQRSDWTFLSTDVSWLSTVSFSQELDNWSKTASFSIDFSTDQKQKVTLTANTMTLTLDTTDIWVGNYVLKIVNWGLATLTWAAETWAVKWPSWTAPTLTSSWTDIISIYFDWTDFYWVSTLNFS